LTFEGNIYVTKAQFGGKRACEDDPQKIRGKGDDMTPGKRSVVLIVSSDRDENHFGTGFVIHKSEQTTYLLTCAHVYEMSAALRR